VGQAVAFCRLSVRPHKSTACPTAPATPSFPGTSGSAPRVLVEPAKKRFTHKLTPSGRNLQSKNNVECLQMEINVQMLDRDAVIELSGRLDTNSSPDLRKTALTLLNKAKCKNLTVDFGRVSFIDTSGLATLLEILVATAEHCGQLTLAGINEKVRYLIDVNDLTGFFRIETSREKLHA
jgi:anti-sigma B factor antagonist